jgi:tRNA A-37 threonylcarbamoyl transferase component Bud32
VVALEYPAELRGSFGVRLARRRRRGRGGPRTGSPSTALQASRKARPGHPRERHLVARETDFRNIPAGRWYVTVDGYLQTPSEDGVVATHLEEKEVVLRRGQAARLDFDATPKQCPVEVRVLWDRRPVGEARIAWRGAPQSLRFVRGGSARLGAEPGENVLLVGSGDRVAERAVAVESFQPVDVEIDLADREGLLFSGCPPAVEPYLHGDVPAAARALEREGQSREAHLLLARAAQERDQAETAARHLSEAGRSLEAAELYAGVSDFETSAALFESAGELVRAGEMYRSAGKLVEAGQAFERARRFESAVECYREAGDTARWVDALEMDGALFEAAQVAFEHDDDARAIRSLQRIPRTDARYHEAANLLIGAYQRAGHLDLATARLEELMRSHGGDTVPLETCDRLAQLLEEADDPGRALEVLELMRRRDATWPGVATRIETLRKRHLLEQASASGASTGTSSGPAFSEQSRYELLEELGRGGMGIVFKARDRRLGRTVALKRLPDNLKSHPKAVELFLREARAAAALNHPNIVTLFDAGQEADVYYLTMELLEGFPLQTVLRSRGHLTPHDVAQIGIQVCRGLEYAHGEGIVHRDIKTGNLFFTRARLLKIMDFGLAKMVEEVRRAQTVIGGTPYYMAPEQTIGKSVDARADLYALGVTLFELATGKVPFPEGDVPYHHRYTPAPDPRERVEGLPDALAELLLALLAKEPEQRPESASVVSAQLEAIVRALR